MPVRGGRRSVLDKLMDKLDKMHQELSREHDCDDCETVRGKMLDLLRRHVR